MKREIEAKLRVDSHEPVRWRLRELRADLITRGVETNWIYDRTDDSLRDQGMGLRVRCVQSEAGESPAPTLTLKGPRAPGPLKSREELEVSIGDARTVCSMLEMLGFAVVLEYQKRRESWRLGACRVELDEPPYIGRFVEIEGPDEKAIRRVQEDLGLGPAHHVPESYPALLLAHCRERGITQPVLPVS